MTITARTTPVHKSLLEIKTIGGAEAKLAIFNGTLTAVCVMGLKIWPFIFMGIAVHLVLVRLTKNDPFLRQIYIRYNRQAFTYDPWPHAVQRYNQRPLGFCRGVLC